MAERMLISSIYFSERDADLGILGLRSAPLNLMMNSKIPSSAPCGVNPGRYLLDGHELLNLINIDLFVRYELCLKFAKSGIKHEKLNDLFPTKSKENDMKMRKTEVYNIQFANTERLKKASVINTQNYLNDDANETRNRNIG